MASCYVTCPAYSIESAAKRERVLDGILPVAQTLGWELVLSPQLERFVGHGGWLPAAERVADLRRALEHDVVWACVVGYGSAHLVEALMAAAPKRPPRLLGYSDITVMHSCWQARGWGESIYTAVPAARGRTPGRAAGRLHPVCVSVLAGLVGTPALPDLEGAILAVEDINEQPYQLDYALWQLHRAGALAGIAGLVGGAFKFKEFTEPYGPSYDEVLAEWAQTLAVPAIARLPFGHIDDGLALPVARPADLRAEPGGDWGLTVLAREGGREGAREANREANREAIREVTREGLREAEPGLAAPAKAGEALRRAP
jgi:muramoyltetrapeptide carboxypeptidase LdcA involved in peptidoglycan recycling